MAAYDFTTRRLFVTDRLVGETPVALDRTQANYLLSVLRLGAGAELLVFNGIDGEWLAELRPGGRKSGELVPRKRIRDQTKLPDLHLLFAPLKHARLDYVVGKAVEMGAGRLAPVITRRTISTRVNLDRMKANVVEAAEQCGVIAVPPVSTERPLAEALAALEPERLLVFCDEDAEPNCPAEILARAGRTPGGLAVLVGPEGGFAPEERELVCRRERLCCISLGPRILRADTAAVAALALVQATLGDWR